MIQALPTASFNLTIPSTGATSTGATSRLASRYVAPTKTITSFAGGTPTPDAAIAPPSVQTYAVVPQAAAAPIAAAPGMSMTTKVALFGGLALVAGVAIVFATRR